MDATFTLVCGLVLQTVLLIAWQLVRDRQVLVAMLRAWRPSLLAGFMGALASQMWFLAFAIASTAHVRTLALVEILFAHALSRRLFSQHTTAAELLGIALVVAGAHPADQRLNRGAAATAACARPIAVRLEQRRSQPGRALHQALAERLLAVVGCSCTASARSCSKTFAQLRVDAGIVDRGDHLEVEPEAAVVDVGGADDATARRR